MTIRGDLEPWIIEAPRANNGKANVTAIAKHVWDNHEADIRRRENALYTWQVDMLWSGQNLQKEGILEKHRKYWELLTK